MTIKPYASPAARALLAEEITQSDLGARLGVGRRTVGLYLDGTVRRPEHLFETLERMTDTATAERIIGLIPWREPEERSYDHLTRDELRELRRSQRQPTRR